MHWIKSYFCFSLPISSKTRSEIAKTKQVVTVKKTFLRLNNNLLEEKLNVRQCISADIFSKFRCNVAKIAPKFINFLGIQKFCICAPKILKFGNFCETIFAYLRTYVHLNPFRMRQQYTAKLVLLKILWC